MCWKETKAHARLTSFLAQEGYTVEGFEAYPTAFKVSYSRGSGRTFGLNSEYDALPHIGHACGHNLIAVTGLGAFLAIRAAMDAHDIQGTVTLIGTPAEEGGAGKCRLYEIGAYDGIGACMMLHPGRGLDNVKTSGTVLRSYALQGIDVEYKGKPAHAGLSPWEGVNALDAATTAYAAISSLRQQLTPDTRVQGVITDGGSAPNVIPAHSAMSYLVRTNTGKQLDETVPRVLACFEGAAKTSGCEITTKTSHKLDELRNVEALGDEYAHVMQDMFGDAPGGTHIALAYGETMGASTDFGNITHLLPGCHPMFGIPTAPGAFNHMPEFTAGAGSKASFDESMKHTTAMAAVGVRYLLDDKFADSVATGWATMMEKVRSEK